MLVGASSRIKIWPKIALQVLTAKKDVQKSYDLINGTVKGEREAIVIDIISRREHKQVWPSINVHADD